MLGHMKKTILSACLLATTLLGVAPLASAMTYTNGDLFLVFRQSQSSANDVEFNIGSISNYLGLTRGTVVPVTAWNSNQVLSAYGAATWTDVINNDGKFVLVAATPYVPNSPSSVCWITDGDAGTTPTMVSGSALSTMISKVRQVAADAYQLAGNGNQYLSIAPGNQGSYSYDVSYARA